MVIYKDFHGNTLLGCQICKKKQEYISVSIYYKILQQNNYNAVIKQIAFDANNTHKIINISYLVLPRRSRTFPYQ